MRRNATSLFLGLMTLITFHKAKASVEEHCSLKPNQLSAVATQILKNSQKDNDGEAGFPSTVVIQSNVSGQISSDENAKTIIATYEAFARIENSGNFSVLPIPLANVELNHERDIVYICAHVEPDSRHNFLEIYFLTGYRLGQTTLKSAIGDLFFNSVKVAPVSISPVGFDMVSNLFEGDDSFFLADIAMIPLDIASQAQRILMSAVKTIFPSSGIERIIMTKSEVIFSAGVDLDNPKKTLFDYKIALTKNLTPKKGPRQ